MQNPPYLPLASLLNTQQTFKFNDLKGALIGYYLPGYLSVINITGFHFHFLSRDKQAGGHVLALRGQVLKVEVMKLHKVTIEIPQNPEFNNFRFELQNTPQLKKVEKGK